MNFSTFGNFDWIIGVVQDLILVLRTNKDLTDVRRILLSVLWGPPFRANPSKIEPNSCNGTTMDTASSNQPRMIAYFAPPPLVMLH